jgi:lysozyme family protein
VSNFDSAFSLVVGIEGGYKPATPEDPGGETKYGCSKRRYPAEDIPNLTLDRAKFLFQRDYWKAQNCDSMEWGKALLVFDCAVNGGHPQRWYSMYAGEHMADFAIDFQAEHAQYLASLPNWGPNARGWMRRMFKIFMASQRTV